MSNALVSLTSSELFLIEMALDEAMWRLDCGHPAYKKFDEVSAIIRSARQASENSSETVTVDPKYDILIEDLDFTIRTYNGLKRNQINTVGDLIKCTDKQLLNIKGMGRQCLNEIDTILANNLNLVRKPGEST